MLDSKKLPGYRISVYSLNNLPRLRMSLVDWQAKSIGSKVRPMFSVRFSRSKPFYERQTTCIIIGENEQPYF